MTRTGAIGRLACHDVGIDAISPICSEPPYWISAQLVFAPRHQHVVVDHAVFKALQYIDQDKDEHTWDFKRLEENIAMFELAFQYRFSSCMLMTAAEELNAAANHHDSHVSTVKCKQTMDFIKMN